MDPELEMMQQQQQQYGGGLAGAGQPQDPMAQAPAGGGGAGGGREEILQEVIRMLMAGIDPDELAQQGVPYDILEEAMQIILQQQGSQGPAANTGQPGGTPFDGGLAAGGMM